jgi:hypothetical protein
LPFLGREIEQQNPNDVERISIEDIQTREINAVPNKNGYYFLGIFIGLFIYI